LRNTGIEDIQKMYNLRKMVDLKIVYAECCLSITNQPLFPFVTQTSVGNVFGRVLLGEVVKHNYVFGNPLATRAARIPIPGYNATNEDTGSGDLAAQEAASDEVLSENKD
jgi:hypothetical protein